MHQITGAVAEFDRAKIVERYRLGKLYRASEGGPWEITVPRWRVFPALSGAWKRG
jgi:hypothetical protein